MSDETRKPDAGVRHVRRGGSWNNFALNVRSASRVGYKPSSRGANTGFRLVSGADNKLLTDYNNALQALYDHVGFVEDWVVCPIDDKTDYYWQIEKNIVKYAKTKKELQNEVNNYYEDEIYRQCFYKQHIYRGKDMTMIFVDTHVDEMKYFAFYDNKKEKK
jgi:hypothetical protein